MRPDRLRAILQTVVMLLMLPVLFFFGLGCLCMSPPPVGNDDADRLLIQTNETLAGPGTVRRSHVLQSSRVEASAGEAQVVNQALAGSFIGLRMPTAADARQPGQLQEGANIMGGPVSTPVAMKQDQTQSELLNELFPPAPGTTWVALAMSNTNALDSLLSGPISINALDAYFNYQIDFGGADPCNGCEVQMVTCVPGKFSAFLPPGSAVVRTAGQTAASDAVACTQPVSTYITLVDFFNNFQPLPGAPVVAGFGLYGGQPTTSTINGQVALPLRLEHTSPTTLTFDLASIQSDRGWTYAWQNMQGAPISQLTVPPPYQPWYIKPPTPNLKVTASGMPICTQMVDVLSLLATNTVTPSLQARVQAYVNVLPDPATCVVVDVAAFHTQQTAVIVGGDRLTYTLTISNMMNATVDGVIEQTLTPDTAVRGANLPAGCSITANVVTCQVANIAPQGAQAVTVEILGRGGYSGELRSLVEVFPANAADAAFLDNVHGPLVAAVNFAVASFPLTVTKSGNGAGVVASAPPGIDCGADCGESFVAGTVVTLTATADANSSFVDWQGACTDSSPICQVTVDAAKATTATFTLASQGAITITKIAENGDATFNFTSQALGDFALTTVGGTASRSFTSLAAGVYDVTEVPPQGWQASVTSCSDGSDPASINLAQGGAVTCTFTSQSSPTDLPEGEEPALSVQHYLPMVNR